MSDTPEILIQKLNAALARNDHDEIIEICTQIINHPDANNEQKAIAYNNLGIAYRHKNEYDHAIQNCDKAIELNPKYAEAYCNRGIAYDYNRKYDRAIQDFDKAIELNPKYPEAYCNRGNTYQMKGEHDRAIQDFDKAIELKHDYSEAIHNRGVNVALMASKISQERMFDVYKKGLDMGIEKVVGEYEIYTQKQLEKQQEEFNKEFKKKVEEQKIYTQQYYQERERDYRTKKETLERIRPFLYFFSILAALALYGFTAYAYLYIHGFNPFASDSCEGMVPKPYLYETKAHPENTKGSSDMPVSCPDESQPDTAKTNQGRPEASSLPLFGLLPFILMVTLILSPVAWYIRIFNRRIEKLWALEEHSHSNYLLFAHLNTAKDDDPDIRKELLKKFFDHHDKRGSSQLIADWDRPTEKDSNDTPSKP